MDQVTKRLKEDGMSPSKKKTKLNADVAANMITDTSIESSPSPSASGGNDDTSTAMVEQAPVWFRSFESRFDRKIDGLLSKIGELTMKVSEQEEKITCLEFEIEAIKKEVTDLKGENSTLKDSLDDLENRSKRNNLVFHGIPECDGAEDCRKTVDTILQGFVGLSSTDYNIERVHRTPTFKQSTTTTQKGSKNSSDGHSSDSSKPRMIHACFSSYTQREKVKSECLKKFKAEKYEGSKIFIADDLSKRVRTLRKSKMAEFNNLREDGKKPFFLYPAKLAYRDQKTGKLVLR